MASGGDSLRESFEWCRAHPGSSAVDVVRALRPAADVPSLRALVDAINALREVPGMGVLSRAARKTLRARVADIKKTMDLLERRIAIVCDLRTWAEDTDPANPALLEAQALFVARLHADTRALTEWVERLAANARDAPRET